MNESRILSIILIVLLILIALTYLYIKTKVKKSEYSYMNGSFLPAPEISEHSDIFEQQKIYFKNYKDDAIYLSDENAIVIFGDIPKNVSYFSFCPYIYDTCCPIGHPMSIADHQSYAPDDNFIIIITSNMNIYLDLKIELKYEFKEKIKFIPLFIPEDILKNNQRFTVIANFIRKNKDIDIPQFNSRLYTAYNVRKNFVKIKPKMLISQSASEKKIISEDRWNESSILIALKITNSFKFKLSNHFHDTYFNKDILSIKSNNIYLEDNQKIIITAIDHTASCVAIFSFISIFDLDENKIFYTYTTGNLENRKLSKNTVHTHIIDPDLQGRKNIRVEERIFVNYDTKTAPDINSVLTFNLFIY